MADKVYHFIPPQDPEEGIGEVDRAIADQNGNVIDETYATKEYVDDAIAEIDVSAYATKEYVNDAVATKSAVSGTSDDTNWTSLTIDGVTHDIPQGGGGSSVVINTTSGSESISDGTNTINVATRDTTQRFTAPKSFFNDTTNNTLPLRIQGFHNHTWGLEMDKDFGRLHFKYADANGTNISNINDQLVLDFLSLYPATNGGKDLGTTSNRWQSAYFTGVVQLYNNSNYWTLSTGQYQTLDVKKNGTSMYSFSNLAFFPQSNASRNLGASNLKWNNLYLVGNLSDGNNATYGLKLPDTTGWTANKTIATTDQITPQWYGTQAEYDALGTYDSNTIYNILES